MEEKTTKKVRAQRKTAVKAAPKVKTVAKTASKAVKEVVKEPVKAQKALNLEVPVYDMTSKELKKMTLPKEVFGVEAKPQLLAQYVRVYMTNARQGNASAKTRSEVRGSTKKVYRQKGTGKARHGSKKAPIFVGGGVTFGPLTHEFSLKINKKQRRKAFFGALSLKAKNQAIAVLSDTAIKMEPKTKLMAALLKNAGYGTESILVVLPKMESNNLAFATRNLPGVEMSASDNLNAYEVLKYKKILLTEGAVAQLESLVAKKS